MTWAQRADELIAQIHDDLPADASLDARRRALRSKAWVFHGGTSWGRRVWSARSQNYLVRHGAKPRKPHPEGKLFAPDIVFPWRKGEQP
ncbi:hypothetical protein FHS31_000791 [Sphingomonas vulcanisoli]|uniref:Uncharacterized protein n=1 Tax=Sphingomonas vulcanisoli TaxID=1658060 RepID=A0ABX0TTV0_9SPHN|nr:hypothetical protein [Sphingomonas vulcanisoli]NIJ07195.1 hypothetical protein [Sphingomonas vulcanisoli]